MLYIMYSPLCQHFLAKSALIEHVTTSVGEIQKNSHVKWDNDYK